MSARAARGRAAHLLRVLAVAHALMVELDDQAGEKEEPGARAKLFTKLHAREKDAKATRQMRYRHKARRKRPASRATDKSQRKNKPPRALKESF